MRAILVARAEQRPGHLAGDHVHFVAVGQRDDHVGVGGAGQLEHVRVRAVAGDGADVEAVLQVAQQVVVDVDDRDVVGLLAGEVVGGRPADLAGPEDDDFHLLCPVGLVARRSPAAGRARRIASTAIVRLGRSGLRRSPGWRRPASATWCPGARNSPAPGHSAPWPSTLSTTPSPNFRCRTRWPSAHAPGESSVSFWVPRGADIDGAAARAT